MATDYNDYFVSKISQGNPLDGDSKFAALQQASQDKIQELTLRKEMQLAREKSDAATWVNQLGLEKDGFLSGTVDLAASLVAGGSRFVGNALSAVPDSAAAMLQANLTEQDIAALGRHSQGIATPEDMVQINRKVAPIVGAPPTISDPTQRRQYQEIEQRKAQAMADANPNSATPLSVWGQMNKSREVSSKITKAYDITSIYQKDARDRLNLDLAAGYEAPANQMESGWEALKASGGGDGKADTAVGVAKLIFNAGAAIASNPVAASQYIAENLPQMMVGALGPAGMAAMSTSNVGYALDNYNKGIQKYQAENGGALPPEEQRQKMAWQTAQLALSEQAGDVLGLGLTKLAGKSTDAVRTGFKESLKNVGKAAGMGVVTEAPTEGYQTYLEGEVTGKPSTGLEIYTGAAIGAASGAGLSGGGRAVAEALGATPEQAAVREKEQATTQSKKKLVAESIASGDVSALLDPKSPSFAPDDAMGALIGNTQLPTTTQEAKDANLAKGKEIITGLETRRKEAQDFLETNTVEGMQALQAQLEAKLATAVPGSERATQLTEAIDSGVKEIATLEATLATPEGAKQFADSQAKQTRDIAKMDAQIEHTKAVYQNLIAEVKPAAFVAQQMETITAPVSEDPVAAEQQVVAKTKAVDEVINLSMASPDRVSEEDLNRILASEDVPENQRNFLREFQAARLAENALRTTELVSKEILNGTKNANGSIKNWGIKDYREQLAVSFAKKDDAEISRLLTQLTAFQIDHEAKEAAYAKALALGNGDQIQRAEGAGNWFVATPQQKISAEALTVNGGLYAVSKKTLAAIKAENAAIGAFTKQYDAALKLVGTTESSNVQNAAQTQSTGVQATAGSPGVTGVQTTTPGAVSQPGTEGVLPGGSVGSGVQPVSQPAGAVASSASSFVVSDAKNLVAALEKAGSPYLEQVTDLHAQDLTAADVAKRLGIDVDMVRSIRLGLGLPEQGKASGGIAMPGAPADMAERVVFEQWRDERMRAKMAAITQRNKTKPAAPAPVVTQEAPASTVVTTSAPSAGVAEVAESTDAVKPAQETPAVEVAPVVEEETVVAEEATVAPVLSVLGTKSPEGTEYVLRQLIADFFVQRPGEKEGTNRKPLASVSNFMGAVYSKTVELGDFLAVKLSDDQRKALHGFFVQAKAWQKSIKDNLPKIQPDQYRFIDMMQFMLVKGKDGKPDIDENLKTAISFAGISWLLESASGPRFNTPKAINALLARGPDLRVTKNAYDALGRAGVYQHSLIDSLGSRVMGAMGLVAIDTAPKDLEARLTTALGAHVMKLLEDEGLIVRTTHAGSLIQELRVDGLSDWEIGKLSGEVSNLPHTFFAIARDESGKVTEQVKKFVDLHKGTSDVLGKLFGVTSKTRFPLMAPGKETPGNTKGTRQAVPQVLEKIVLANQAKPRKVRADTLMLFNSFETEEILTMAGVAEEENFSTHLVNRRSLSAKNDGLRREYDLFMEFVELHLALSEGKFDTEFFLEFSVWKQQRVGIATNAVNPQASKIVRFLTGSPDWTTEVDSTDEALMNSFYLRVGEGLGVKTEKVFDSAALDLIKAKLLEPVFAEAIKALVKSEVGNKTLDAAEKASVLAAVAKGGEKLHSLDALIGVARQMAAQGAVAEDAPYTFTVQMMGEVDGVANGTMLNHVLLGAGKNAEELTAFLHQGGFFEQGSEYTQYNQYRGKQGNFDIYENTGLQLHKDMQAFLKGANSAVKNQVSSIWAIAGSIFDNDTQAVTKDGRNLIKDAMNPLAFGSSLKSVVRGMADTFVGSIYSGFEKLSVSEVPASQEKIDAYVANVNALIANPKDKLTVGLPIADYMEIALSSSAEKSIAKAYSNSVGEVTSTLLKAKFSSFLSQRDRLNKAVQTTFSLYDAVYRGVRDAYIAELVEKGEIDSVKNGKMAGTPIADLNKIQEAEVALRVKKLVPVLRTVMSKQDVNKKGNQSDGKRSGLLGAKTERKQSYNPAYESRVAFGTQLSTGNASVKLRGFSTEAASPSVMAGSALTHSSDSAISHFAQSLMDLLNVHDAVGTGVGKLVQAARLMNKSTWEVLLEYSPLHEAHRSMSSVIQGIAAMETAGTLPLQAKQNIQKVLEGLLRSAQEGYSGTLEEQLSLAQFAATVADRTKLESMATWAWVDQYAASGGNYEVTDTDRAKAKKLLAAVNPALSTADNDALAVLNKILNGEVTGQKPVAEVVEETIDLEETETGDEDLSVPPWEDLPTEVKETPFGKLGKASIESDKALVDFFKAKPLTTAKEVIAFLSQPGRLGPINRKILYLVSKVIRQDMQIKYITKDSKLSDVLEKSKGDARGWCVSNKEGEAIYFTGAEFAHSGLTAETVLHELLHGALARTVNAELLAKLKNDKHNTHAYRLVKELEDLRVAAQKYVTDNKLTGFADALSNVQEFITWGMTNQSFQAEVLNKITFASKTQKTTLVKAMTKFIDALAALVFKNPDQNLNNGLRVLIDNVSGLAAAASKSDSVNTDINQSQASNPVDSYTTLDMHEALASESKVLDPGFNDHLRGLLKSIVGALHGPFGVIHAEMRKTEAGTPMAVWLKAVATGKAAFASKLIASRLPSSAQEDFAAEQVEVTLRAALDGTEAATKVAYKELSSLFTEAKDTLSAKDFYEGNDWATATPLEVSYAQEQYDLIFKIEDSGTEKNNYLARFAALGLTNQKFNKLLQFATKAKSDRSYKGKKLTERLEVFFQSFLEFLQGKVTKTWVGQQADQKMLALVSQLVDIEAKNRATIKAKLDPNNTSVLEPLQDGTKKMVEYLKGKAEQAAKSKFIRENSFAVVRLTGAAARVVAGDRVDLFMDNLLKLRDTQIKGHYGMMAGYLKEVVGHVERFKFLTLATKLNEKIRKDIITSTAKAALKEFADSKKLTKEQKAAITAVFMRSGAHNLLGQFTTDQLETLLSSPAALKQAIADQEALITGRFKYDYITEAAALGYKNATGISRIKMLKLNARLIASRAGTAYMRDVTGQEIDQVEPLIASLVALRSMSYMTPEMLKQANSVLAVENKRGQQNGVRFVLQLHQRLEQESRERLFFDNPALMQHGFTPETYNPYVDIQVVNDEEGAALLNRGYEVMAGQLNIDKGDTNQERKRVYVRKGSGLMPYVSGSMALKTLGSVGSKVNDGFLNPHTTNGLNNAVQLAQIMNDRAKEITTIRGPGAVPDFHQTPDRFMVPLFNESGEVVNWRYIMEESTKDTLLERDNSFDRLLGSLAGSIFDKESSKEQNYKVVQALKDQYDEEYATRHKSYVLVGPKSADPKLREIWKMLPEDTKAAVRAVWGIDSFSIRADSLYLVFGHRKLTAATMFATKDKEEQTNLERKAMRLAPLTESEINLIQKIMVNSLEWMLSSYAMLTKKMSRADADKWAKRAGYYVGKGEGMWQAMVAETKDIIVVKTGVVMLGNIYSNISMLMLSGVSIKEMAVHHLAALKGATAYHDDSRELARLRILQDSGYDNGTDKDIDQKILRLEDDLARNPVKELIDAGLMPTIVEDIDPDDEVYGYKKDFMKATEQYVEKLPKWMRQTGKTIYMSHDGDMYKGLSRVTQLSDFVARYTLYQHMINRKKDPLSKKDAVMRANDTFVNYDYPMQPGAQYLDDMGFTPFMKYFLRIQKELLRVTRENPGKVLMTILFNQFVELGPIVLDGSAWTRIGNFPIQLGAPKFFTVIDDLATVNTGIALFK